MYHECTKHIDIRMYFVRDLITRRQVVIDKIQIEDNSTYILTKKVPSTKFKHYLSLVRVART